MNCRLWILRFTRCLDVMDVNRSPFDNGSSADEGTADGAIVSSGHSPVGRHMLKPVTVDKPDLCVARITEPCGIFGNRIKHRLDLCRGAGNNSQDLTRRRLLLQGLFEFLK